MKTVVITGASVGIGRTTAQRIAEGGFHVVNLDRNPLSAADIETVEVDLRDPRHLQGVLDALASRLEVVGLVNTVHYCYPRSHGDKLVVVQVETAGAARDIDAMLAIPGIDVFFIGPVDLAKSMGHRGDYRHPDVTAEVDRLIDRIHGAGRASGILVDAESVDRYRRRGVQFLYCHVNDFLKAGVSGFLERQAGP